jgi:hypothetical protein
MGKKRLVAGPLNQPYAVFLIFEFHTFFIFFLDQAVISLEGPGSVSALVVSSNPVVTAALPLRRWCRNWRRRRRSRFSLGFVVGSSARRSRFRSFNGFMSGRGIPFFYSSSNRSSNSTSAMVLKSSHHECSTLASLKVASRRSTASGSRNFHVVESRIASSSVITLAAAKSGIELGPRQFVVLVVHRCSSSSSCVNCIQSYQEKAFQFY